MTVASTTNRWTYTCNGVTTTFPYTKKIFDEDDLVVTLRLISDGTETTLTITTHYSVTGVGSATGGNVETVSAYSSDYKLIIRRVLTLTQETSYAEGGAFHASAHEDALDRIVMMIQQLDEALGRSLQLPVTSSYSDLALPEPEASTYLKWNAAATALENTTLVSSQGDLTAHNNAATSHTALDADGLTIDRFTPSNYTPAGAGTNLASHLSGIDTAIVNVDQIGYLPNRNFIINGEARIGQRVSTLDMTTKATGVYAFGSGDRFEGAWTGTACTSGTFGHTANQNFISGSCFYFVTVTLTGSGTINLRYRMESEDAIKLARAASQNYYASFGCRVDHTVGAAINFTIAVRKANAKDDFSAVTAIGSNATSVADSTYTTIKYENVNLGDCSNGLEILITATTGAITNKTVLIGDIQAEISEFLNIFKPEDPTLSLIRCQRYYQKSYNLASAPGTATEHGAIGFLTDNVNSSDHNCFINYHFPVTMRCEPGTITSYDLLGAAGKIRMHGADGIAVSITQNSQSGMYIGGTRGVAVTGRRLAFHYVANAEF